MPNVTEQLVLTTQAALNPDLGQKQVALFNPDGTVLTVVQVAPTAATMLLTGYAIAGAAAAVGATDSVNVAIGKLEKRVLDLENA